jgi:hypothetical protein
VTQTKAEFIEALDEWEDAIAQNANLAWQLEEEAEASATTGLGAGVLPVSRKRDDAIREVTGFQSTVPRLSAACRPRSAKAVKTSRF